MVRHLFFPLMRLGVSKQMANVFIFTFSAVMHELLISVRPIISQPMPSYNMKRCKGLETSS